MGNNYIKYAANTYLISMGDIIEFERDDPEITKIVIEMQQQGIISITFFVSEELSEIKAKEITKKKLNIILDKISFVFEAYVSLPRIEEININGAGTREFPGEIIPIIPVLTEPLNELKRRLVVDEKYTIFYSMYRDALKSDPISRFMFLYSLLGVITGVSIQEKIDKFILSEDPNVEMRESTKVSRKGKRETIYTFLRNQVGHMQKDSNISQIKQEIENYVSGLAKLVKKAIERRK